MAQRTGWDDRSASYKSRLVGAGQSGKLTGTSIGPDEVRAYWESGGDLRGGRSHRPQARAAAPREAAERESIGMGSDEDYLSLQRWRHSGPAWLPRNEAIMGTDTAAILSQIDIPPSRWKHVEFTGVSGGHFVMTVTPKHGYDRMVLLPDREAVIEVGTFIRKPVQAGATPAERKRLEEQWGKVHISVNATGTDEEIPNRKPSRGISPSGGQSRSALKKGSKSASKKRSTGSGSKVSAGKPSKASRKPSSPRKTSLGLGDLLNDAAELAGEGVQRIEDAIGGS